MTRAAWILRLQKTGGFPCGWLRARATCWRHIAGESQRWAGTPTPFTHLTALSPVTEGLVNTECGWILREAFGHRNHRADLGSSGSFRLFLSQGPQVLCDSHHKFRQSLSDVQSTSMPCPATGPAHFPSRVSTSEEMLPSRAFYWDGHGLNLHCPIQQPLATSAYSALEMWLVRLRHWILSFI